MRILAAIALAALPAAALAAGSEPATPTRTVTECPDGQVWDAEAEACLEADETGLTDTDRLDAARTLARFDRPGSALAVLAALDAPGTADALTVRGYATRRAGDRDGGLALYRAALAIEPDHWQARSYMGQAFAEAGETDAARAELAAIRASGGRGTWEEVSLRRAIAGEGDY